MECRPPEERLTDEKPDFRPGLARLRGFESATHRFSVSHAHQAIDFAHADLPDLVKNGCGGRPTRVVTDTQPEQFVTNSDQGGFEFDLLARCRRCRPYCRSTEPTIQRPPETVVKTFLVKVLISFGWDLEKWPNSRSRVSLTI
jgi:hypothetical protein